MKASSFSDHMFTSPINISYSCTLWSLSSLSLFSNQTYSALDDSRWGLNKVLQNGIITFQGWDFKLIHNLQEHAMPTDRQTDKEKVGQMGGLKILKIHYYGKRNRKDRLPSKTKPNQNLQTQTQPNQTKPQPAKPNTSSVNQRQLQVNAAPLTATQNSWGSGSVTINPIYRDIS